ncbi:MAG: TIGR02678 family protein [Burkholderiaceae bacterium]|nr:TIGR02678 family protein [Burkholderiaceae bacterium]
MSARPPPRQDSQRIGELQKAQQQDEFSRGLRALLMRPLMAPDHEDFPAVRRQAERLRDWFARETGWPLHVEREGARLFKRPANLADDTRGLPTYDKRRYVLLCLACAVLERADPQITLQLLGERVMQWAAEPTLTSRGFEFTLRSPVERRDLVAVCKTLLEQGVLQRVAGDEENFIHESGWTQSDALYDVQRRMLAGMLAAVRGPSTWRMEDAPVDFEDRLRSLVVEHVADGEQGRRDALRHHLARRLLDDPVIYTASLDADAQAYFVNQRGTMAGRLCDATGLTAEQRAEGLALTDESGQLTDVSMPAEGTEAHATLLVAEYLAQRLRNMQASAVTTDDAIAAFLRGAVGQYGRYWRKSAREPGAEKELADIALDKLHKLQLIAHQDGRIHPLPAIARFSIGETQVRLPATQAARNGSANTLFDA